MKAAYDRDPERFRQRTRDYHATDAGRETHRRSRRLDKKRNAARVRATERRRTAMPEVKKRTKANRKRLRSADPEGARAKDRANARKWRAMNRSRWNSYQRARRYGLTPAEIDAMLASQGGRCAVCGTDKPTRRGWFLDHDHSFALTDRRGHRGIVCMPCNSILGLAKDDPEVLDAAARYILGHRVKLAAAS